jgi:hypothetical protein
MSAQMAHFGLIAGMSWVPVQLLSVLRLTQTRSTAARLRWIAVLAVAMGLTILAGEPRAIADAGVIVVIYAAWRVARLGRRCGPAAISVAAGLVLGLCLGAVQWMPGLAVIGSSQRGANSVALFSSGSLPHRWLLLLLVPDLLGGSGSLGQPGFFANYNLAEVTGYVGIFPLVAAAVLLGRFRLRPRLPEWIVWHFMALAGVVLALGGGTPLGGLLAQLRFSVASGCKAATSSWRTWPWRSCSPTGPTTRSAKGASGDPGPVASAGSTWRRSWVPCPRWP